MSGVKKRGWRVVLSISIGCLVLILLLIEFWLFRLWHEIGLGIVDHISAA
jgi:hypothetical protein